MFDVIRSESGPLRFVGRLDASQVDKTRAVLDTISESCVIDFAALEYISSAGLGALLATQKRLGDAGHSLTLAHLNKHIREIFRIAGFDIVFPIE
jgi:anti-anti-sigma factor